jgi:hypothetical protein
MFIGENLTEKQIAALQAVADACIGYQFASVQSVIETAEQTRSRFRCLYDKNDKVPHEEFDNILNELEKVCLIERKNIKDKPHVGLTDNSMRCNF